jgi:hypothetical protein
MSNRNENTNPSSGPNAGAPCDPTSQSCQPPPCTRAEITMPKGSLSSGANPVASWLTSPCHHFDFQGVVSGSPGPYVLQMTGVVEPSQYSCQFALEAGAGTLTNPATCSPTHAEPAAAGEGTLTLTGTIGGSPASCTDNKRIKIYQDHLARDNDNFGVGINCTGPWTFTKYGVTITEPSTWNCFGSVDHHYNGSGSGYTDSVNVPLGWANTVYDAPLTAANWAAINAGLHRGDVVSFWSGSPAGGFSAEHAHTSKGGTAMYGANNEPAIRSVGLPLATWKWFETTSETYFNNVNASPRTSGLLTRVIVYRKP